MRLTASLARLVPVLALLALLLAAAAQATAADRDAALARAGALVEAAHGALTASAATEDKHALLKRAIGDSFAFDVWERFLVDAETAGLTPEQSEEFRALLPGFLAQLYSDQFGKGLEAKPEISEARQARRDILVRAAIPRANGKTLPVDWRIRDFGERGHLVIDVMVGGTSFLILKRDEFDGILKSGGPAALLDFMREN
ncbi:MAG: ABC transporter substrate-binding protein, partial [Pseudomonadota bacterium]